MKPVLASLWQRRWCRSILWIALAIGLACVHPFVRQTLFGPKIDGIPWYIWEREARIAADPAGNRRTWLNQLLDVLGIQSQRYFHANVWRDESAIPILLALVDEADAKVRRFALEHLDSARVCNQVEAWPYLERRLQDDDPNCRFLAGRTLWRWKEDPAAMAVLVALVDCEDWRVRDGLAIEFGRWARDNHAAFETLDKLCRDSNARVQMRARLEIRLREIRHGPLQKQAKKDSNQKQ